MKSQIIGISRATPSCHASKKLFPLLLAFVFVFAATNAPTPEPITVEGTLVDTKCYGMMPDMNKGNTHKAPKMMDGKPVMGENGMPELMDMPGCATACGTMGIPAGVATEDGKTYIIIASASALAEHMSHHVRVTGEEAFPGGLIAMKIEAKHNGKWEDITPAAMM